MRDRDAAPRGRTARSCGTSPPGPAFLLLALALASGVLPARVAAQDGDKVQLEATLADNADRTGARQPIIRTLHLLDDSRWLSVLTSGFPLRLHYRLEIWKSRGGWFDSFERQVEWDVVIQQEPLLEQYTVATITSRGRRENRVATLEALRGVVTVPFRIAVSPAGEGGYYYTVTLQITTLSDSDLQELERFLRGDLGPAAGGDQDMGNAVGRGARRLLLRIAGLPTLRLEARTEKFRMGKP